MASYMDLIDVKVLHYLSHGVDRCVYLELDMKYPQLALLIPMYKDDQPCHTSQVVAKVRQTWDIYIR